MVGRTDTGPSRPGGGTVRVNEALFPRKGKGGEEGPRTAGRVTLGKSTNAGLGVGGGWGLVHGLADPWSALSSLPRLAMAGRGSRGWLKLAEGGEAKRCNKDETAPFLPNNLRAVILIENFNIACYFR